MSKILLRIAGGIDAFFGAIGMLGVFVLMPFLRLSIGMMAIPVFLMVLTAIVFLYVASLNEEELKEKRILILLLSIGSIFIGNLTVGALGIAAYMILSQCEGDFGKRVADKKKRRMSLLLTLGVLLIILAGIVFATSTWEFLDGYVKTCVLLLAGLLFFGISGLAENKLKLPNSSVMYYLLGCFFAVVAYFSAGVFSLFGNWFSTAGAGQDFFLSTFALFVALVAGMAFGKYRKNAILYVVDFAFTMAVVFLCGFFEVKSSIVIFVLLMFFGGFVLANQVEKSKLRVWTGFSKVAFLLSVLWLIWNMTILSESRLDIVFAALSVVWTAIVLYVAAWRQKTSCFRIFAPILSVGLLAELLIFSGAEDIVFLAKFALMVLCIFAIGFMKREDKLLFGVTAGVTDVAFTYLVLDAIRLDFSYFAVVTALAFLLLSFVTIVLGKVSSYHFERFLEPLKVVLLIYAIYDVLLNFSFATDGLFVACIAFIFAWVQLFKKGLSKQIYFLLGLAAALLTGLWNITDSFDVVIPVLLTASFSLLLFSAHRNREVDYFEKVLYALSFLSLFITVYRFATGAVTLYFYLTAMALLALIFALLCWKSQVFRTLSLAMALFPLYAMAQEAALPREYMSMVTALTVLLFLISYTRGILKGVSWKFVNILETVAIGFWFLSLIFGANVFQGIVIGIVAILFVLIGYRSDKMWSFYYTGIVATILNLWQQLRAVWSKIPFWAYMLFAGLLLVGFVTYQEYSGRKEEELPEDLKEKEKEAPAVQRISSEEVISGTIIYFLIFVSVAKMLF